MCSMSHKSQLRYLCIAYVQVLLGAKKKQHDALKKAFNYINVNMTTHTTVAVSVYKYISTKIIIPFAFGLLG